MPVIDLYEFIDTMPKPVIAAVNGFAVGGGNVLHVVCDLAVAAPHAVFRQVGPMVGSFDAGYGTWYLEETIGRRRAKEMWYLNQKYSAEQALDMGLVNEIADDPVGEAPEIAQTLRQRGPFALGALKTAFSGRHTGVAGQARLAHDLLLTAYRSTQEAAEMSDVVRGAPRARPVEVHQVSAISRGPRALPRRRRQGRRVGGRDAWTALSDARPPPWRTPGSSSSARTPLTRRTACTWLTHTSFAWRRRHRPSWAFALAARYAADRALGDGAAGAERRSPLARPVPRGRAATLLAPDAVVVARHRTRSRRPQPRRGSDVAGRRPPSEPRTGLRGRSSTRLGPALHAPTSPG